MKLFTALAGLLFLTQVCGPGSAYADPLVTDSSAVKLGAGNGAPIQISGCRAACLNSCNKESGNKKSYCSKSCSQKRCSTPFGCSQVYFISFGGYLVSTGKAKAYSSTDDYLLDESRGSVAAVKDRLAEVGANLQNMKNNPEAKVKYFNQLFSRGCSVRNPAEAFSAYGKYKAKLDEWLSLLKSPKKSKRKALVSNISKIKKQKAPIEVDKEFADSLLLAFETCGLSSGAMDDYFSGVSYVK